jgi:hypothetical protein
MTADGEARSRRKPMVTAVPIGAPGLGWQQSGPAVKPTPAALGVDLAALDWQRSGTGHGSFEIAFVAGRKYGTSSGRRCGQEDEAGEASEASRADWVLLRIVGDPEGRVLVYDRNEWTCFLDGAWRGEFDWPDGLTGAQLA